MSANVAPWSVEVKTDPDPKPESTSKFRDAEKASALAICSKGGVNEEAVQVIPSLVERATGTFAPKANQIDNSATKTNWETFPTGTAMVLNAENIADGEDTVTDAAI